MTSWEWESSELPSSACGGASGCSPKGGGSAEMNQTEGGRSRRLLPGRRAQGHSPKPQGTGLRAQLQARPGPLSPLAGHAGPPAPRLSSEQLGHFGKAQHLQKVRVCPNWGDSGLRQGVSKSSSRGAGPRPPAPCEDVGGGPTGGHYELRAVLPPARFCPNPPTPDETEREAPRRPRGPGRTHSPPAPRKGPPLMAA